MGFTRRKKALPGQLVFYYGRLPGEAPDFCVCWGGDGASKRAGNLILSLFTGPGYKLTHISGDERHKASGLPVYVGPSLVDELRARGFDLNTIYFSIQRCDPARPPKPQRLRPTEPGHLTVRFAKLKGFDPDLVFSSGGAGADTSDSRLLCNHLSNKRPRYTARRGSWRDVEYEPSFIDELVAAGFDLSTFFFSVQHKGPAADQQPHVNTRPKPHIRLKV